MTNNNFFNRLKKVFSMKNDTVEDARRRFKRALICIPFSLIPTLFMLFLQGAEMSTFTEYFLFAIFAACLPASFVALSSPIGPIKAAIAFEKWFFSRKLTGVLLLLYPIAFLISIFGFVYIICSAVISPVFLTLYGAYKSKKHLEELEAEENMNSSETELISDSELYGVE